MSTYRLLTSGFLLIALSTWPLQAQEIVAARLGAAAPTHIDPSRAALPKLVRAAEPDTLGAFMFGGALVGAVVGTVAAVRGAETHDLLLFPLGCMLGFAIGAGAGAGVGFLVGEAVRIIAR